MRKNKAIKTALFIASTVLFLSAPASIAHAEEINKAEQGIAGIAEILDKASPEEVGKVYKAYIEELKAKSPYANLGVSIADNYVNIRKEPTTDSEIVGLLYRGGAVDILDTLEDGWVKIKSGEVEGYIASNYLAIGDDASDMVDKYATKYATVVNTETLRVRDEQSTDAKTLDLIPLGEKYLVVKEYDQWAEILLGTDEDTGKDITGFVNKDYVDISVVFQPAISMKEIKEAEKAEEERKRKLAEEEAERKEAERKAAEAQKEAEEAAQNGSKDSSNDSSNDEDTQSSGSENSDTSSSLDELRQDVVNYALKFVGNPYVWGGESLTKGADCSGFVQSVYRDFGYSLPRVSRDQAASAGKKVSESELKPGDLIFYASSSGRVNHVAMYIGGGRIVQAANSRQGIITSSYRYREIYCIRRIIY